MRSADDMSVQKHLCKCGLRKELGDCDEHVHKLDGAKDNAAHLPLQQLVSVRHDTLYPLY